MYRGSKKKMRRRFPALVVMGALAAGGLVALAGAAGASTHEHSAHGATANAPGPWDANHAGGRLTAVSATSLSVQSPNGTTATYTLTSSTTVTKDGLRAAVSDLAVGERVRVKLASATSSTIVAVDIATPHVMGQVVSVAGNVITIANPDGLQTTVDVSGTTIYTHHGANASLRDVTAGSFIAARGTVASDHTTFNASSVIIGLPRGADAPGPIGDGHGPQGQNPEGPGPQGPGPMGDAPGDVF